MGGLLKGGEGRRVVGCVVPLARGGGYLDHIAGKDLRCIEENPLIAA